jgi:Fe-S cluster assembly protein SufD
MSAVPAVEQFTSQHRPDTLVGHGTPWLDEARRRALDHLSRDGLPRPRDENWKYTPIRPVENRGLELVREAPGRLDADKVAEFGYPGLACHRQVFENGRHVSGLSGGEALPEGMICLPLAQAIAEQGDAVAPFLERDFAGSEQGFAAMNAAFAEDGLYVHVPEGVEVEVPLMLLFAATDAGTAQMTHPRVILHLARGSRLKLIENFSGEAGHRNLTNMLSQVRIDEGAELRHLRVQNEASKGLLVNRTDVSVAGSGKYTGFAIDFGGRLVRHDLNVSLDAAGADCALNGLYVLGGRQHVDNHTRVDHRVPNTHSEEIYKGVLDGHSRGVFNGKVVVAEGADGTDASQSNANLLLSRDAEIDTKPELEIYADDVKCAHGSTVGQLDRDALFYLRTRGLEMEDARGLLTYAFCREVIDRLQLEPVRDRLKEDLLDHLPTGLVAREML